MISDLALKVRNKLQIINVVIKMSDLKSDAFLDWDKIGFNNTLKQLDCLRKIQNANGFSHHCLGVEVRGHQLIIFDHHALW